MMWYQIIAPTFASSVYVYEGVVQKAAPYLARFRGKLAKYLWAFCRDNGYLVMEVETKRVVLA